MEFLSIASTMCLLFSSSLLAESTSGSRLISATNWTPAKAETIQSKASDHQLRTLKTRPGSERQLEVRKQLMARRTGFGATPHAQLERDQQDIEHQARQLAEIQNDAISKAASQGVASTSLLAAMMPVVQADSVNMTMKTPSLGAVTGGGLVYAYNPDSGAYLGYSGIASNGSVNLPVVAGQVVDVIAFVNPPFAFQVARGVTANEGVDLMLLDAVEIDVSITDLEDTPLPGVNAKMNLILKSYIGYGWSGGNISGNGKLYLAPGESYELDAQPDMPYLASERILIDSSIPPLAIKLERGLTMTIVFDDPSGLIGKDGCTSNGYMNVYSSQDVLNSGGRALSNPQRQLDANNNLVGFVTAVPVSSAFDYEINFDTNAGRCLVEDISSRFVWSTNDFKLHHTIRARPIPNIIFQTPAGDPLTYSYGYFYGEGSFAPIEYFTPTSPPSLIAGETYWVNLRTDSEYSVNETRVVAQEGSFDVVVESEALITVKSTIKIGDETNVSALLELYREGVLVEAFEYRNREVTMEIPAGTYDVRVSGITGSHRSDGVTYNVILKPSEVSQTFTGTGEERVDFDFTLPQSGVHYTLPNQETPYLFSVYEDSTLRASQVTYPWYGGIRTDFSQFDLVIRGPGFDDERIAVNPSEAFPGLDIAGMQGPVGRLQGVVVDQSNNPVEGVNIDLYAEDGLFGRWLYRTGPTGSFDIPKVKNGLFIFTAPDAGNSVMQFVPVSNAGSVENVQIRLEDLEFHSVSEGGPTRQLIYGTGNRGYQVAFLSEAYVSQKETFTDSNLNQVWDGVLYLDMNNNGLWDQGEPFQNYGEHTLDYSGENGTDITIGNEPFSDLNGDGYPNIDDFSVFVQNSKNYIRSLLGTPDIKENIDFDAYIVFLPSEQAGTDVIDDTAEEDVKLIDLNTRFGGAYLLDRSLLSIDYSGANAALDLHAKDRDLTVVMLNQPVRVGRANSFILAYGGLGNSSPNSLVAGHEFGHNPGRLADEYNEFNGTATRYFSPSLKHLTHRTVTADLPWFSYIGGREDLPISVPQSVGNGVYAGGSYNAGGAYRSTANSRMRSNAPYFNDISLDVFRHSLCVRSLRDADFIGRVNQDSGEGTIFKNGFEAINGVLTVCSRLQ